MKQKDKCAIILVRVSTSIQNFEPQINDLLEFAKNKGYNKFKQLQTSESGLIETKNEQRFNELKTFIDQNPEYDTIFATELSRIARKQSTLHKIKEWLERKKIQLYLKDSGYSFLDENTGEVSMAGSIMFTLFGYFAESEMNTKKERFKRAKEQWALQGYSISGKRLFGYNREKDEIIGKNRYVINKKETEEIIQIYQWYANGISSSVPNPSIKIIVFECMKNNFSKYTFSKRNVNKLLKEEGYLGEKITNNKKKNPKFLSGESDEKYVTSSMKIIYPPIISKELFNKVQIKLKQKNTKAEKFSKHVTILSQTVTCKDCNRSFVADYRYTDQGKSRSTYRCSYSYKRTVEHCKNTYSISMRLLDSTIWSVLKSDLPVIWDQIINVKKDETKLREQINNLEKYKLDKINEREINQKKHATFIFSSDSQEDNLRIENYRQHQLRLIREIEEINEKIFQLNEEIIEESNFISKNLDEMISNDISSIEKNKLRLKEIIKTFIKEVKIIYQDIRFVIIEFKLNEPESGLKKSISEYFSKIIIDKKVTLKIRLVKCLSHIEFRGDGLYINDIKLEIDEAFGLKLQSEENLKILLKNKNPYNLLFKPIHYEKLKLYDKSDYSPLVNSLEK
jgi:DNA invertase Pin-like site-specific DNA recombinase